MTAYNCEGRRGPRALWVLVEAEERLSQLATVTGRSKSYDLRELVTAGLDELEYAYGLVTKADAIAQASGRPARLTKSWPRWISAARS